MKDIQSLSDNRRINIKKVGVKTVTYPISLRDKLQKRQHTIAVANMYVNLPHHFKGTHMSRFVEILNEFHGDFDINKFSLLLERMKARLEAQASHLELFFPFFLSIEQENTPLLYKRYQCKMAGSLDGKVNQCFTLEIPVSLPQACSVSADFSSSQMDSGIWGKAEISVHFQRFFWIEDLIIAVEHVVEEQRILLGSQMGRLSAEALSRELGEELAKITELGWFSVTVHHFRNSYSTFAHVERENHKNR